MNYYKQGDAAKADQIKVAFEEIVPNNGYDFKYSDVLFFTYDCDGRKYIMSAKIGTGLDHIILTHPDYKELELPKPHYDIANFHAGMPVLVRIDNSHKWSYTLFSHYNEGFNYPFCVASCCSIKQCIPFEGNEHLLGTTDMPSEEYINW